LSDPEVSVDNKKIELQKPLSDWDLEFCKKVDQRQIFNIMLAANYLEYQQLIDVTCKYVALQIKNRSKEEICQYFECEYDFTEDERQQLLNEYPWLNSADVLSPS